MDLRFSRIFRFGQRNKFQANLDLYNLFNSSSVLNVNTRYGPAWLNAVQIMGGRLAKVSFQFDF